MPWPPEPDDASGDDGDVLELALLDDLISEPITSGSDTTLWDAIDIGQGRDGGQDQEKAETPVETSSQAGVTSGNDSAGPDHQNARKRVRKKRR
jgi:hypothetical protein